MSNIVDHPDTACYVIYSSTRFAKKSLFGYKPIPDHNGKTRPLPSNKVIRDARKRAGVLGRGRFALAWVGSRWQAFPGYGIQAGNLNNKGMDTAALSLVLSQPDVAAIYWVNGEEVEVATQQELLDR